MALIREPFNSGWRVSVRQSLFESISGGSTVTPVTLPHDALQTLERSAEEGNAHLGYFREGSWYYFKTFEVPADWASRRVTLEFQGAYRDAMVYVNGAFAAQWAYGYSTFYVPLDPYLQYGETNTVRVEVQIHHDSRWYSGAGLYRPVSLLVGDLIHIAATGPKVTTPELDDELAVVVVATDVVNEGTATRSLDAIVEIRDAEGAVVATDRAQCTVLAGETLTVRNRTYIRAPKLWAVDSPNLYSATVRLSDQDGQADEATTTFGVRTLSLDPDRGLRINGETVKLRGASLHHDHGVIGAVEFPRAAERRIAVLKEAGFNAIRSAAKPASPAILDACDRLGMLVMDETFDMWTVSKIEDDYSRKFPEWWRRDIDALVAKDFNHPSVILYAIGCEIIEIGTPHGARLSRLIAERIREQDPTRLITNSINGLMIPWPEPGSAEPGPNDPVYADAGKDGEQTAEDFNGTLAQVFESVMGMPEIGTAISEAASSLDVLGYNYGDIRYEMDKPDYPNRIVMGSETFPSRIAHLWKTVVGNSHVIGDFTWVGWEYLGEPGVGRPLYPGEPEGFTAPYPWLTSLCADIDLLGQRRPVSYYREVVYGLRKDPYLAIQRPERREHPARPNAWSWSDTVASWTWAVDEGTPITLEAYADAEEVAFIVNGDEVARSTVGTELAYMATADVSYVPGTAEAVAYIDGVESGRFALKTAGPTAAIALAVDDDVVRTDDQDIVFVEIALVDPDGVVQTAGDVTVSVELEGPAVLQGLGSARPATEETFRDTTCTTYQGRALAVLRYSAVEGSRRDEVRVLVTAAGLPSSTVAVRVIPKAAAH